MRRAMEESQLTSISSASIKYNIPIGTLHRHIKKDSHKKQLGRFRCVFSPELEKLISEHARELDARFYGLTRDSLKQLAYRVAEQNAIKHPFKNKKAGEAWLQGFMSRNPDLSFRTPEPTSIARCSAFNRHQVGIFYDNLWNILEKYELLQRPDDIFNMDETGVKTSAQKPPKVPFWQRKKTSRSDKFGRKKVSLLP
ncbi:uncharacterized protein LOC115879193 [Sitophilus oryzae]|uniref:Uncharacterized protein LOC115879193 n=1 Tax=Sitophilus oryzae TaxID=7048 RepID=A0A6J2XLI4_SITOR|nr:uncharacterized protein LOC115879193 [Sitophilus oryzae]